MTKFKDNNQGNISIIAIYLMTIISLGALYTLLFIEFAIAELAPIIPGSFGDYKTFILMFIYAIPIFIILVSSLAVLKNALKREVF